MFAGRPAAAGAAGPGRRSRTSAQGLRWARTGARTSAGSNPISHRRLIGAQASTFAASFHFGRPDGRALPAAFRMTEGGAEPYRRR